LVAVTFVEDTVPALMLPADTVPAVRVAVLMLVEVRLVAVAEVALRLVVVTRVAVMLPAATVPEVMLPELRVLIVPLVAVILVLLTLAEDSVVVVTPPTAFNTPLLFPPNPGPGVSTMTSWPPIVTCALATGRVITYPALTSTVASSWLTPGRRTMKERTLGRWDVVIWTFFLGKSVAISGLPGALVAWKQGWVSSSYPMQPMLGIEVFAEHHRDP
jgi:hypothetical protein